MSIAGQIMITKRGGSRELFEPAKPRRCLTAALRACKDDDRFADALVRAVEFHLRHWTRGALPTSDYVFRCLRTALIQTGMQQAADQLALHRRRREMRRQNLAVLDPQDDGESAVAPWRKSDVARTLEDDCGLSHSVARILAGEVERRVLALDYTVVSKPLIAEVINNELMAWGLAEEQTDGPNEEIGPDAVADRQPEKEF
jgi:hypothetical protein